MRIKEIKIKAPHGLHLRVAAEVVKEIKNSQSKVLFLTDKKTADASSILDLLILGASQEANIKIVAKGNDEDRAIQRVTEILTDGAGI